MLGDPFARAAQKSLITCCVTVRETFRKVLQRTRLESSELAGSKLIAHVLDKRLECRSVRLGMNYWRTFLQSLAAAGTLVAITVTGRNSKGASQPPDPVAAALL